jgi:twitching motility protein PilI
MNEPATLKSLRDRPFELLAELERRGRAVTAAAASENPGAREWVGVAFRMAGELYLAAREETREVLAVPPGLTRVPGAKPWVKGIANVRGQLLPILDLRQYLGSGVTPNSRNVRVIVVNHREVPAGLVVDEVLGFRRFSESEFSGDAPPTVVRCERYLAGAFRRGPEQWPVLSLRQLVESPSFQEAGGMNTEGGGSRTLKSLNNLITATLVCVVLAVLAGAAAFLLSLNLLYVVARRSPLPAPCRCSSCSAGSRGRSRHRPSRGVVARAAQGNRTQPAGHPAAAR